MTISLTWTAPGLRCFTLHPGMGVPAAQVWSHCEPNIAIKRVKSIDWAGCWSAVIGSIPRNNVLGQHVVPGWSIRGQAQNVSTYALESFPKLSLNIGMHSVKLWIVSGVPSFKSKIQLELSTWYLGSVTGSTSLSFLYASTSSWLLYIFELTITVNQHAIACGLSGMCAWLCVTVQWEKRVEADCRGLNRNGQ